MKRTRVLICDDNRFFRRMIKTLLQRDVHINIVGDASGGREAVRLADKLRPDVVLMDQRMPDMTGDKATRLIKRAHPEIKVLVLTFLNDVEIVANCMQAGASGYVVKGLRAEELVRAIQTVRKGAKYFSPERLEGVEMARQRAPAQGAPPARRKKVP